MSSFAVFSREFNQAERKIIKKWTQDLCTISTSYKFLTAASPATSNDLSGSPCIRNPVMFNNATTISNA
jgi:hypothetical protein